MANVLIKCIDSHVQIVHLDEEIEIGSRWKIHTSVHRDLP
jgi:hypothetical protein